MREPKDDGLGPYREAAEKQEKSDKIQKNDPYDIEDDNWSSTTETKRGAGKQQRQHQHPKFFTHKNTWEKTTI